MDLMDEREREREREREMRLWSNKKFFKEFRYINY